MRQLSPDKASFIPERAVAPAPGRPLTRRQALRGGAMAAAALGLQWLCNAAPGETHPGGRLSGLVRFEDEEVAPAGELIGSELDGRLFTDLSRVSAGRLATATREFYIRSAASRLLPDRAGWKIEIDGPGAPGRAIGIDGLRAAAKPMGMHLMECAGNVAMTRFGLMSVADWAGVPLMDLLDEAKPKAGAGLVEVTGFDQYAEPSRTSIPGASWIFPIEQLKHAFLAAEMNGQPLNADHGAPVRLMVPGWYGCACIKWVNRISFVDEGAEASLQMKEYAVRTLQEGRPELVRDFQPAIVEAAALPVRVEKWIVGGKVRYRVVGIAWGGSRPIEKLQIRFNPGEEFRPVAGFRQLKTDPWTVWNCDWVPGAPGGYHIRLAIAAPQMRARRLDMGLYDRTVHISEI